MSTHNLDQCDPRLLAKVIGLASSKQRAWRPEELAAILKDQLSAPVPFELVTLEEGLARKLRTLASAEGLLLKSMGDLLEHPNPPVELLDLTRQFAKACSLHPDSHLPPQIAKALYYASIAAAMLRCGQRITTLDNQALADAFGWFDRQPWLDQRLRSLFRDALKLLASDKGTTA